MAADLKANQLNIINRVLKYHPQVADAIAAVTAVMSKAKFPIQSFADLTDAMGGAEAKVQFGGRSFAIGDLEHHIPAYYFPISNENDLLAKFGDLSKRLPTSGAGAGVQTAHGANINPILMAADAKKPAHPAPTLSVEEMHRAAGFTARPAPGIGGIQR